MSDRRRPAAGVRIMLVDDHPMVRRGVQALLEMDGVFRVCAEAEDCASALELAAEARPDVVVLDLSLPDGSGLDLILALKTELPDTEIVVFTLLETELAFGCALRAGARGYVFKSDPAERLVEAVRAAAVRQSRFSPAVSDRLLETFLQAPSTNIGDLLTTRERQVVRLIAQGYRNKYVGSYLGISLKTVEAHRNSAMRKVGAHSTADLTRYAARNQLIEL